MHPDKLHRSINLSGFPLQIAIAKLVSDSTRDHGWTVLYTEHAWRNYFADAAGHIDIVLENVHRTGVLVIECKRVLDTAWIFLLPSEQITTRANAKIWISYYGDKRELRNFYWYDIAVDPVSHQSAYCVVPGSDAKNGQMIEPVAADVLFATEALAREEEMKLKTGHNQLRMYASVIVTTAQLMACEFDAKEISPTDGTLKNAKFQEVPFLRFRKQLTTHDTERDMTSLDAQAAYAREQLCGIEKQELVKEKEHTVFVVNSNHFLEFLSAFEIQDASLRFLDYR
jgi:hypothetical protein